MEGGRQRKKKKSALSSEIRAGWREEREGLEREFLTVTVHFLVMRCDVEQKLSVALKKPRPSYKRLSKRRELKATCASRLREVDYGLEDCLLSGYDIIPPPSASLRRSYLFCSVLCLQSPFPRALLHI